MSATVVVHVNGPGGFDVYIGRRARHFRLGWLPSSPWANPYKIESMSPNTPDVVLAAYERHVRGDAALMARLHELRGKRLGCWCKAYPGRVARFGGRCHGDVLVRLVEEMTARDAMCQCGSPASAHDAWGENHEFVAMPEPPETK